MTAPQPETRAIATSPEAPAPAPRKARPKPKGPQPARAITILNGSSGTITGIEITGSDKTVRWTKPIASQQKVVVKLPVMKGCSVSVLPTFESDGPGAPGDVDICKDRIVRLID